MTADVNLWIAAPQATYKSEKMFPNVDNESLVARMACNKCGYIISDTSSKIVLPKNCQRHQLRINYTTKLNIQLIKSLVRYACYALKY